MPVPEKLAKKIFETIVHKDRQSFEHYILSHKDGISMLEQDIKLAATNTRYRHRLPELKKRLEEFKTNTNKAQSRFDNEMRTVFDSLMAQIKKSGIDLKKTRYGGITRMNMMRFMNRRHYTIYFELLDGKRAYIIALRKVSESPRGLLLSGPVKWHGHSFP